MPYIDRRDTVLLKYYAFLYRQCVFVTAILKHIKRGLSNAWKLFKTSKGYKKHIFEYIEVYYNHERLHSKFGYMSLKHLIKRIFLSEAFLSVKLAQLAIKF